MGGPIIRTGTTPAFWANWDNVFGGKKSAAKTEAAKKSPSPKKAPAKKASAKKKAAKAAKKK